MAATADWMWLGTTAYRKTEMFAMLWEDLELDHYIIAAAPYGGPIAMVRDHRKLLKMNMGSLKSTLDIYTASGATLAQVPWQNKNLVKLAWTDEQELVAVLADGTVMLYAMHGEFLSSFSLLSPEAADAGLTVLEVHAWGAGLVALTSDIGLVVAESFSGEGQPSVYPLARSSLSPSNAPTAMAVLPPAFTNSGRVEVLLGTPDNSIVVVDEVGAEDQLLQSRLQAAVTRFAVCSNGRFIAVYCADGVLTVLSSSFATKVLDFDSKSSVDPIALVWSGEDSVVLQWRQLLLVVGPYGSWLRLPCPSPVHLVSEPDCCRIVTALSHEVLQKVPTETEAIKRIGSTLSAAMLFDAQEAYESGDAKADDVVRGIEREGTLGEAVEACINAALAEFDVVEQQAFLRAAAFGKSFARDFESEVFVDACRKLRVLNAVRQPDVGMPLTIQQCERLTPEVLVDRLVSRRLFLLALRICDYLSLPKDGVLVRWAIAKLKSPSAADMSAEDLCELIHSKLSDCQSLSYSEIAVAADRAGRRQLATLLLDYEAYAADQVSILLSMREEELALQKALASGDSDLIFLVLLHLERATPDEDQRLRLVSAYPEALAHMAAFVRAHRTFPGSREELTAMLERSGQHAEAAVLLATDAASAYSADERQERLEATSRHFAASRDLQWQQRATDDELELLAAQRRFEEATGHDGFVHTSLAATITNLIALAARPGQNGSRLGSEAAQLSKKFKLSDKRFWHLKSRALAASGQWPELRQMADKKSPIGYKPFAELAVEFGQPTSEVEYYAGKVSSLEDRYQLYVTIRSWDRAGELAFKLRDPEKLSQVRNECSNSALIHQVDEWAQQLGFS